ncbi:MAG TPA: ABC transporter permease [Spirochaetales bacterium]|nr:ABC transporter permease [Spirochaetales bacterium]HPG86875.1 ABC transporter permease [Spirochaetales bacterium]
MPSIDKNNDRATNEFNQYVKPVSLWADAWKRLRRNKMAVLGMWIVAIYMVVTFGAALLPFKSYTEQEMLHINLPPSFKPAGVVALGRLEERKVELEAAITRSGRADLKQDLTRIENEIIQLKGEVDTDPKHKRVYILGTDYLGRDMLARTIYGGQISIMIGLIGTLTAAMIGIVLGSLGGYLGGWVDNLIGRFVDLMYSLPYMLVVIIIMSMLPTGSNSIFVLYIAIAMISWLTISRVVRGQIISLKNSEFVEAARSMGAGSGRIIFRHLLPNSLGIIIIYSTLQFPSFIMNESFLSFLGLGVSAPRASWGTLVSEGVQGMQLYPWRLLVPAVSMTVFLFAMNFLGDGLRDALDPQSKNRN